MVRLMLNWNLVAPEKFDIATEQHHLSQLKHRTKWAIYRHAGSRDHRYHSATAAEPRTRMSKKSPGDFIKQVGYGGINIQKSCNLSNLMKIIQVLQSSNDLHVKIQLKSSFHPWDPSWGDPTGPVFRCDASVRCWAGRSLWSWTTEPTTMAFCRVLMLGCAQGSCQMFYFRVFVYGWEEHSQDYVYWLDLIGFDWLVRVSICFHTTPRNQVA